VNFNIKFGCGLRHYKKNTRFVYIRETPKLSYPFVNAQNYRIQFEKPIGGNSDDYAKDFILTGILPL
jgi:hypothetical protein